MLAELAVTAAALAGLVAGGHSSGSATEIVVGRINVNRREFWLFSSDSAPRRILSESINETFLRKTARDFPGMADYPRVLVRSAVSPDGQTLAICDAVMEEGPELRLELALTSLSGHRRRVWKPRILNASSAHVGFLSGQPGVLLTRDENERRVSFLPWGRDGERRLDARELPPLSALAPHPGRLWSDEWPVGSSQWMLADRDRYGRETFHLRSIWQGGLSRWTVSPDAIYLSEEKISLPVPGANAYEGLQTGPATFATVIAVSRKEDSSVREFDTNREIWLCTADGNNRRWRRLTDGESITGTRFGPKDVRAW
ncbi:hypothetical protein EON81_18335 [bacterium]|nr:MAG: hypothetical protein EON81_18335 [bacterium]